MVEAIKSDMSKTVNGILIKYSLFVNQTSAPNVSTTKEKLPLQFKNQLIASGFYLMSKSGKSKASQSKSNEEMILVLFAGHLEDFYKSY